MSGPKYSSEEILQIEIDFYNCQSAFDPEVYPGAHLTFETPIKDWVNIRDLVGPKSLANAYHELFNLTTPVKELEDIFSESKNSLKVFCDYIAHHSTRQAISPVTMLGRSCMTAAIFKTLINNLKQRGVQTENIRPSSKFVPLFDKHSDIFFAEVNKLAPGCLSKFENEDNWISKAGIAIVGFSFLTIIIVSMAWHFQWALLIPLILGIVVMIIGSNFKPAKLVIGGYDTMRDLIIGIELQLNKTV